jgi:parallel beta-helix repeat protein
MSRPLLALLALAAAAAGLAAAGLVAAGPAAAQDPPAPASAGELALAERREQRVALLDHLSRGRPAPFLASPAPDDPTVVLTPRPAAWTIAEVRSRFPAAFSGDRSAPLLGHSLFVARGAALTVRGRDLRQLRLLSTPTRFVTLSGWRATIELTGSRLHPLTVSSWDPGRGRPDTSPGDGRAFVLARGSAMTAMTASFAHLGFGDGRTSGVAWAGLRPAPGIAATPSSGAVTNSTFRSNRIGAYSDLAPDMTWTRNRFLDNSRHGLDAHSGCTALVLDANTATGNGGHGILLARGCRETLVQGNLAARNRASGIVLGNGSATSATTRNTVISNTAVDNAAAGLVVDGGTANRLRGNTVRGGGTGIELRDARANPVEGNTVSGVRGPGIDLDGGAANKVTGNRIERSQVGLYLKRAARRDLVSRNQVLASAQFGIYLSEGARGVQATGNYIRGAFSGIRAKDAAGNRIVGNTIVEATDSGISLHGDVRGTLISRNLVAGRGGRSPIEQLSDPAGLAGVRVEANDTAGWEVATPARGPLQRLRSFIRFHPTALLWTLVLLLPALLLPLRLWHRRRLRRWHPAAVPLALADPHDERTGDA